MRNLGFKTLLIAITLLNSSAAPHPPKFKVEVVVIDPGHGGRDPGTHGAVLAEKDVVLKISLKVGALIEKNCPDVKVIFTRKDDRYMSLDDRAILAIKNKADVFICIHANASQPNAYGTETYVMGPHKTDSNMEVAKRENSVMLLDENHEERYEGFDPKSPESYILFSLAQSASQESSLLLADKIEKAMKSRGNGSYSHGVKQAGFWVLWRTAMPSVLVEVGFLTNRKEEKYLSEEAGQDQIANGIYKAFKEYKSQIESVN